MIRYRTAEEPRAEEENPYWMSFSDIMAALLVVFILAAVILILEVMERQREFDDERRKLVKAEEVRRTILDETRLELAKRNINVVVNENHTVLSISNALLGFETGEYELLPAYQDTAREIGDVLGRIIRRYHGPEYLDTVFVEGHTDSRPYLNPRIKGNWGLSAFRAISLWEYWEDVLPAGSRLSDLTNGGKPPQPMFSVSGYAATRPLIKSPASEEDHSRNRRIDIRFTVRQPSRAEFDSITRLSGDPD